MAEIKPLPLKPATGGVKTPASPALDTFVKRAGPAPKPRTAKLTVKKLSDPTSGWVKMLSYGHTGTGKTYALVGLLQAGLKILVISTDVGGEGLNTVRNALRESGQMHLADNLLHIELPTYEDVETFLKEPHQIFPEIYDTDIDMLVWDGFSGFQQQQLSDYIAELEPLSSGDKTSEGREAGLWFERTDWGMVRNGTIRNLGRFLSMHNKVTGKKWHKYVTALESGKASEDKLSGEVQKAPLIQGSAAALMGPAFDLIFQTRAVKVRDDEGIGRKYLYYTTGHEKLLAKSRGLKLEPIEPADMAILWKKITAQLVMNEAPAAPKAETTA